MAYRCRAYPDETQQRVLAATFGCVRLVRNRTLAARRARWHHERMGTSYAQTDRALTEMEKDPNLAFLNEVSSVPLQVGVDLGVKDFAVTSDGERIANPRHRRPSPAWGRRFSRGWNHGPLGRKMVLHAFRYTVTWWTRRL